MDDIVKALNSGNHKSFELLFETHYSALCRYACSIVNDASEAEDIVQKVFCKLWDQRSEIDIRTSVKSYLYRIVHNESLNLVHQRTSRAELNMTVVRWGGEQTDDVNDMVAASELQKAIEKAISSLAPQCRKVFEMSRIEQLSYSEIASNLQISINTVENHISKALKLLRVELKDFLVIFLVLLLK
jgi:RNA polymerase sigma-70 factor (ECF subfamily)